MTKESIEKACNWLIRNIDPDMVMYSDKRWSSRSEFINRFRKAMEQ